MREPDQLTRDLGNHFHDRLMTIINDASDTCEDGDMKPGEIIALLVSILLSEATRGCVVGLKMTEEEFLAVAKAGYRKMVQLVKADNKRRH